MTQMPEGFYALHRCDDENAHPHHMHGGEEPGSRAMYCLGIPDQEPALATLSGREGELAAFTVSNETAAVEALTESLYADPDLGPGYMFREDCEHLAQRFLALDWLAQRDTALVAEAKRETRNEWADWLSNWDGAVTPTRPTVRAVIDWLRSDQTPFGRYAATALTPSDEATDGERSDG